jgi:ATP-binding cassette, subfamily B, bacterial
MADKIIVLKEGRIVEQGCHQELLAKQGEYAALWRLQAEKYAT